MKARIYSIGFIIVFMGLLLAPLRTLALDPYEIGDSFYGRSRLIALFSNLRLLIGDRVFPKTLVGDNGWLIYTAEGDIEDYQRIDLFTEKELSAFRTNLDALSEDYAGRGITLLLVIPPNKNTIYPERVPEQIPVYGTISKLDQVVGALRASGKTRMIDLRSPLLAAKEERQIYYATDTHWNDYGAYIAYSAIMNELHKTHPNLAARPASDFEPVVREPDTLDLAAIMGTTLLPESRIQFAPMFDLNSAYKTINLGGRKLMFSYNRSADLPDLVMYHDSFFFNVIPMLGEHFHNSVYVQNFSGGGLWNFSWVDERKPDVVIIEFAERYLDSLLTFIVRNQ
ncbi:MAG: hypothetical protein HS124_05500 [Anaerolineales bacterium]|nr:hypothetical protein [Anaerolineales bacterium]MCL4259680.1 hypothetical protein [Anaerolineales bacterium]